jgi:hypothetical protein
MENTFWKVPKEDHITVAILACNRDSSCPHLDRMRLSFGWPRVWLPWGGGGSHI